MQQCMHDGPARIAFGILHRDVYTMIVQIHVRLNMEVPHRPGTDPNLTKGALDWGDEVRLEGLLIDAQGQDGVGNVTLSCLEGFSKMLNCFLLGTQRSLTKRAIRGNN